MKKNILILILILLISGLSFSQEFEIGMNVTRTDLTTSIYEKEPDASALMVYDYGNAFFNKRTFRLNIEYKQKIKILTTEGLQYGQIEIPLYVGKNPKETIEDIAATVYNLENDKTVITKLSKDAIFKEENENYNIVKLVLPNIKVGSVITYSYTKTTSYISKFAPWYFQTNIPTLYSEYNASIPGNYEYNIKLVGSLPLKTNTADVEPTCIEIGRGGYANCALYKYVMTDIPSYKPEEYTTTKDNYLSRIEYELSVVRQFNGEVKKYTKSWQDVDEELKTDSDFGRLINRRKFVKDVLPNSIIAISDKKAKAKAIYQFVLDNYKWDNSSGRYDADLTRLTDTKSGNAFEINLLLQNLLHDQDLESYPMLVSTRENGLATKIYPVLSDFNYAIVKLVLGKDIFYLDATNPYLAFGELPFYCLNQYGRVYDIEYASYWEDIIPKDYSTTQIKAKYKLNESNKLVGNISHAVTGYSSHNKKQSYADNPTTYLEQLKNAYPTSSINEHKVLTKTKNDKKFLEELELIHEEEFIDGKIYFNPFIYKFYEENPFKLTQRTYPIDFGYKQSFMFVLELDLNDNLNVLELPKAKSFALPNNAGLVNFSCLSDGKKLTTFVRINLNKAIYSADYYDALKQFMAQIIDLQNNTVVVLEKL